MARTVRLEKAIIDDASVAKAQAVERIIRFGVQVGDTWIGPNRLFVKPTTDERGHWMTLAGLKYIDPRVD